MISRLWRGPLAMAASTIFGLLAALLGQTEGWWIVSWIALSIPLAMIAVRWARS